LKNALFVFLGAGIGGVIRHVFNVVVVGMTGTSLPWGIMAINIIGSTLMGIVVGWFYDEGRLVPGSAPLSDNRRAGQLHDVLGILP
jgi:CrcB protein